MKKLIATLALTLAMTTPSLAGNLTVLYPQKYCSEIVSQEYSTGGGNKVVEILEILCKASDGSYRGFVLEMGSLSGALGLGRFFTPDTIIYKPYNGETLKRD